MLSWGGNKFSSAAPLTPKSFIRRPTRIESYAEELLQAPSVFKFATAPGSMSNEIR